MKIYRRISNKPMRARTVSFFICVSLFVVGVVGRAQTGPQYDELQKEIADLQRNPADDTLREKIIKLALTLDPKPKVPDEALEAFGAAKYAFKGATSEKDYLAAAENFGKAALLAPWVPEYYFNEGASYEKAKRFDEAIKAFKFYLLAAPNAEDANAVRERIGGLRYQKQKSAEEAQAAAQRAAESSAAAERDRLLHGGMEELRRLVSGKSYSFHYCDKPWNYSNNGCTWEEYQGKNWYGGTTGNVYCGRWEFDSGQEHARYVKPEYAGCTGQDITVFRVSGTGQRASDLTWEYYPVALEKFFRVTYLKLLPNGEFIFSTDAPADPSQYPKRKFHYQWTITQ